MPDCDGFAQVRGASDGTWIGVRTATMALPADAVLRLPAGMSSLIPMPPSPVHLPKGTPWFAALRTQLGLKLVRSRGEIRMLVIDHIEKPSENE